MLCVNLVNCTYSTADEIRQKVIPVLDQHCILALAPKMPFNKNRKSLRVKMLKIQLYQKALEQ